MDVAVVVAGRFRRYSGAAYVNSNLQRWCHELRDEADDRLKELDDVCTVLLDYRCSCVQMRLECTGRRR